MSKAFKDFWARISVGSCIAKVFSRSQTLYFDEECVWTLFYFTFFVRSTSWSKKHITHFGLFFLRLLFDGQAVPKPQNVVFEKIVNVLILFLTWIWDELYSLILFKRRDEKSIKKSSKIFSDFCSLSTRLKIFVPCITISSSQILRKKLHLENHQWKSIQG